MAIEYRSAISPSKGKNLDNTSGNRIDGPHNEQKNTHPPPTSQTRDQVGGYGSHVRSVLRLCGSRHWKRPASRSGSPPTQHQRNCMPKTPSWQRMFSERVWGTRTWESLVAIDISICEKFRFNLIQFFIQTILQGRTRGAGFYRLG